MNKAFLFKTAKFHIEKYWGIGRVKSGIRAVGWGYGGKGWGMLRGGGGAEGGEWGLGGLGGRAEGWAMRCGSVVWSA